MKIYKLGMMSRVMLWIADRLPARVRAGVAIDVLDSLDDHYRRSAVIGLDESTKYPLTLDDGYSVTDILTAHQVERLRRRYYREVLRASAEDA